MATLISHLQLSKADHVFRLNLPNISMEVSEIEFNKRVFKVSYGSPSESPQKSSNNRHCNSGHSFSFHSTIG